MFYCLPQRDEKNGIMSHTCEEDNYEESGHGRIGIHTALRTPPWRGYAKCRRVIHQSTKHTGAGTVVLQIMIHEWQFDFIRRNIPQENFQVRHTSGFHLHSCASPLPVILLLDT